MSYGLIESNTLSDIANAIRYKLGTDVKYTPYNMPNAINSITGGGGNNSGGGGIGFNNEYIAGYVPLFNIYAVNNMSYPICYMDNIGIKEAIVTNQLPTDNLKWVQKVDYPGMSVGNVYAFLNGNREYTQYNNTYYTSNTFGFYLENGNANSKFSILNMDNMFYYCYNLINYIPPGDFTTSMYNTYYCCSNITGSPICGNNVLQFSNAYYGCYNITGNPVCGENVVNMSGSYGSCSNLTGSPVVGNNVLDMNTAYYYCYNITGDGVCPNNVIVANGAYAYCYNLNGTGYVGSNVRDSRSMYYGSGITKAVVNNGVKTLYGTFYSCNNLSTVTLPNSVTRMIDTFSNCQGLKTVTLPNTVEYTSGTFNGCKNLRTVTLKEGILVANRTFMNCSGLTSISCPDSLINACGMYQTWSGSGIMRQLEPICGNKIIDMASMYSGQSNLIGNPVCSPNARNMYQTYYGCSNLTGSPVFSNSLGDNNFENFGVNENQYYYLGNNSRYYTDLGTLCSMTYAECFNITGNPVVPSNIKYLNAIYKNCYNLTGNPVSTPIAESAYYLYYGCNNLTGSVNMGINIKNVQYCFFGANKVETIYFPNELMNYQSTNFYMAFNRSDFNTKQNVIVTNLNQYNTLKSGTYAFGGYMTDGGSIDQSIEVEGENINVVRYAYNTSRNCYLYCTV